MRLKSTAKTLALLAIALFGLPFAAGAAPVCPNHPPSTWPCPEGVLVVEGSSVDGWPVWIGRTCAAASVDKVMHVLLDDAALCAWRPGCAHYCRIDAPSVDARQGKVTDPLSSHECDLQSYTIFANTFLSIPIVRIGSLSSRRVTADASNMSYRIEENSLPNPPATLHGVQVVSSSSSVFVAAQRADSRTAIEYCQWAVPPIKRPRWAVNAGSRSDVERTLEALRKELEKARDPPATARYRCSWPLQPCSESLSDR